MVFSLDGVEQPGRVSDEAGWQPLTFTVPAGTHQLRWTYGKNRANTAGSDAGWRRQVSYSPTP